MKQNNKTNKKDNKRYCSANGFSLLPLALQSRLFCLFVLILMGVCIVLNTHPSFATSNLSLNLSINNNTNLISLNIASLDANGTFRASDVNGNNITVSTNNYTGYTLGILAKTANSNDLSFTPDGSNTTYTIPSITSSVSQSNYSNDNYAETNHLNNTWGYRPSTLYDTVNDTNVANTDYLPAPTSTSNQTIIAKTNTYNTTNQSTGELIPDNYNIAIGSRIDSSTVPGEYTNTFVITAVANAITYNINYNANDGNNGQSTTNMPNPNPAQVAIDANTPAITLPSSKPIRSGYLFKGWCTVQEQDNATTCSGNEYRPGTELPVDYTTNAITLYARWIDATLWNAVVDEWEIGGSRIQTNDNNVNTGIQAAITTANSGVFQYNSTAFNGDTDAAKPDGTKYDIYYFRGILDSNLDGTTNTYGSNGDGVTWPNYVKLGDTCWRIVRTTGSGGVKMIYNGKYSTGTTANSCANATTDAQVVSRDFNDIFSSYSYNNIISVGYTYNNNYKTTSADTPYGDLFGTNSSYSGNTTDSVIKNYIENTWFASADGISAYESMLEPNAGYCNDRSLYTESGALVGDNTDIITPYTTTTSGVATYRFGTYYRNLTNTQPPSLACPRDRVDVYTISTTDENDNVDTYNGNGQLKYPVALLTADEASFAGSGSLIGSSGSALNVNSYLRSGNIFWLLSPSRRSYGNIYISTISNEGANAANVLKGNYGVRPVVSFAHGTTFSSGTGIAVDPYVVATP